MPDDNGDGFDPEKEAATGALEGARYTLGELKRQDGQFAKAAENIGRANIGVLKQAITVEREDEKYRQLLYLGDFADRDQARKAVAAIDERRMCGVDIRPVLDDIAAMCGVNAARLTEVLDAMSHTTFTTNYKKGQDERKKSGVRGLLP